MHRVGKVSYLIQCLIAGLVASTVLGNRTVAADDSAQAEFFERYVRPILVSRCLECHGPDTQESGLRVDSRERLLAGGDSGPSIIPGDSAGSRLVQAVRRQGDLEMPPDRELPKTEVAALERWIQTGAFWPRNELLSAEVIDASNHWSFQPIQDPPTPETENRTWSRTSIDPFILAQLEAADLSPSASADRSTLIRRLNFDLLGLSPSYEEAQEFVQDPSPDAYAKLVDRLLASPQYGERWGRLWLDVARYADTKGFAYFEDLNYPYAYSYRDYVVNSFNEDLPYDDFVSQQLAADQLPQDEHKRSLAALGFLTVGQRFMNNLHDVLDDRIDVVTRGLMGLTVACARCHDHKYDPIPTADYYSLYGVFRSSSEPLVGPVVGPPPDTDEFRSYEAELQTRVNALTEYAAKKHAALVADAKSRSGKYLLAAQQDEDSGVVIENFLIIVDPGELNPTMRLRWQSLIRRTRRLNDPVLTPWHAFAALPAERFAAAAQTYCDTLAASAANAPAGGINPIVAAAFVKHAPTSLEEAAKTYGELLVETESLWQSTLAKARENGAPLPDALANLAREELRQIFYAPGAPANIPLPDIGFNLIRLLPDRVGQEEVRNLLKAVEQWAIKGKDISPRAMVLRDSRPHEPRVFHRGNPSQPRQLVPRQFLSAVAGKEHRPFSKNASGRLDLAKAIVSPKNPLTARVIANRVWMHHFGSALVRTPSDFGLRSERPVQEMLLDHLASRLIDDGWSLKQLHRRILLSASYRQANGHRDECAAIDAENRLYWRQNRRRRGFESIRDSLLVAAGVLNHKMGGSSVDLLARPYTKRRAVYGFVNRIELPSLFSAFDFPSPDTTSAGRSETMVPQQTLFMMNHHFVVECAGDLLERTNDLVKTTDVGVTDEERIRTLYRLALSRNPQPEELAAAAAFFVSKKDPAAPHDDWSYGSARVAKGAATLEFTPLPHWSGTAWRETVEAPQRPSPGDATQTQPSGLSLNLTGGTTVPISDASVVRRWTAPGDVQLALMGTLTHVAKMESIEEGGEGIQLKKGDGVHGRLISSRHGELGRWEAHGSVLATEIKNLTVNAGETLDFVVDGGRIGSDDAFDWPVLLYVIDATGRRADTARWSSLLDFRGPQADAWQQFAQAMLMTNEFIFVD